MEKSFCQRILYPYIDTVCIDKDTKEHIDIELQKKSILYTDNPKEVLKRLLETKILYLHPNSFDQWTDIFLYLQEKNYDLSFRLVIIAGSDYCIGDEHMEALSAYFPNTHFWIQNWVGSLAGCRLLPLGVNNSDQPEQLPKEKLLGISYLLNYIGNEKRESFFQCLEKYPSLQTFFLPKCSYKEYCKELSKCYYSTCPMGEGFDTYRFWECLSMGTIPIVKSHEFYDGLLEAFPDIPIVSLKEWDDLIYLQLEPYKFPDLPYTKNAYWIKEIEKILSL